MGALSLMLRLGQRFILRDLKANPLRTSLTVLGIALGVAVMVAMDMANHTVYQQFQESVSVVAGRSNLEVVPQATPTISEKILLKLKPLWEYGGRFTPMIEQTALWPYDDDTSEGAGRGSAYETGETVQLYGVDFLADPAFRTYVWQVKGAPQDYFQIFEPDAAYVGEGFARRHGLKLGSPFRLLVNDGVVSLRVRGILQPQGIGKAYSGQIVVMDLASAQVALGWQQKGEHPGRISRIECLLPQDLPLGELERLATRLQGDVSALDPNGKVQRPAARTGQVDKMLSSFQANLMALSFIALLVGMFMIYNTISISVVRRRYEIGTMRTLGVSRRQIFTLFFIEALFFGLAGSALGVALGVAMASGAVEGISQTVETLYTGHGVSGVVYAPWKLLLAFALGIFLTLMGGFYPILEATQVSAAEAARRGTAELRAHRQLWPLAGLGVILLLVGGWAAQQPPLWGLPLFGYGASLCFVFGLSFLLPAALRPGLDALSPLLRRLFGPVGALALGQLKGSLGRTAVATASLMVGIALMVSLAVMIESFRTTVGLWVNQTLRADLWIQPVSRFNSHHTGTLTPSTLALLKGVKGIKAIDPYIDYPIALPVSSEVSEPAQRTLLPTHLAAGDMAVIARYGYLRFLDGDVTEAVMNRALASVKRPKGPFGVVVTESFAQRFHVQKGSQLNLPTPRGPIPLIVEGVYYDYTSEQGYLIMPLTLYQRFFGVTPYTGLAVYLQPGESPEAVRESILRVFRGHTTAVIRTNQDVRAEVFRVFDRTFAITYALHAIAIGVALLGVMTTLMTLVMEHRREYGILKYLGAGADQLRRMVLIQGGTLASWGLGAGILLGVVLSFLLIFVINKQSFGWTIQLAWPWAFLLESSAVLMITAIVSALYPARLAMATVAPEVIRVE